MFERKINNSIESLKQFALVEAPRIMAAEPPRDMEDYLLKVRGPINIAIIGLSVGGEITQGKKDNVLKFNKKLPTMPQLAQIKNILDVYIKTIEEPFLASISCPPDDEDEDDMNPLPKFDDICIHVPKMEKPKAKEFRNYVFGKDGREKLTRILLNGNDLVELCAIGEELRKRKNFQTALIIGGITLLVIGGVTAGVMIYNKKKNDESFDTDPDFADLDIDLSNDELDDQPAKVVLA